MLDFSKHVFVGVDPHKAQHTIVVLNGFRQELLSFQEPATPAGFQQALDRILEATPMGLTPIFGIEDTGGLGRAFAQWLVSREYVVKGVNPVMSNAARRRRPHPDKSDPLDAKAVAKVLMDEFDALPKVRNDANAQALREATRRREELVRAQTRCKNQLHNLLHQNYPEYKQFFGDPFCKTGLAFWHAYPHPSGLDHIGVSRLGAFLNKQARGMSKSRAQHILSLVDKRTPLTVDARMRMSVIRQLVEELRQLETHIAEMERLLEDELTRSDTQLLTIPGVGTVTAATILGRLGARDIRSGDALAKHSGIAPRESGSGDYSRKRRAKSGDRQLNAAFHRIALSQIGVSRDGLPNCPVAYEYYQRKIREGKTKLSAITCLKRRLCDIVFAILRDGTAYRIPEPKIPPVDPAHRAA